MSDATDRTELVPGLYLESSANGLRLSVGRAAVEFSHDEGLTVARALVEASAAIDGLHGHRIPMQYLVLTVEPDRETGPDEEPPPAEVHVWVKEQTPKNAFHIAAGWLAEDGLRVTEVTQQVTVTRPDFEGTELLEYYEQALTDDEVFLYVTISDEPEADPPL